MKLKKIFKDEEGSAYVDAAVKVFVFAVLICIVITVLPVFSLRMELSGFANDAAKIIERRGCYDSSVRQMVEKLAADRGLSPEFAVDTVYISGTSNIQIGESITVTAVQTYNMGFWIFGPYPVRLSVKAHGLSEVFYK